MPGVSSGIVVGLLRVAVAPDVVIVDIVTIGTEKVNTQLVV
jgi:hypothetical protein